MKTYSEYWTATLVRGLLAILAGTGVLFFPELASMILVQPVGVTVTILCLAAYGVIDSALVLSTSFMLHRHQPGRLALRVQGLFGASIGILLFAMVYDHINLQWFLYLAALQAAAAAITEFAVARGTSRHHGWMWCYVSSGIAAVSALVLLLGRTLEPRDLTWLLFAYLGLFGFNMSGLAARMLFAEREVLHAPQV